MLGPADWRIGLNIDGAMQHDGLPEPTLEQRFALLQGDFAYLEKTLHAGEDLAPWWAASQAHSVPLEVLGGIFDPEVDAARSRDAVRLAREHGIPLVNCQVRPPRARAEAAALAAVGDFYLRLLDAAAGETLPCLEPHVDMWLEAFARVEALAEWLARRGAPLYLTLDHSHLIYRLDDPEQLAAAGIDDPEEGRRLLAPESEAAFYHRWQALGLVVHAHVRCVRTAAPPNPFQERAAGVPGRGIQYPLVRPGAAAAGEREGWCATACDTWKQAVREMLRRQAQGASGPRRLSCEFIPYPDYGGGRGYSLIEQNRACAHWLRTELSSLTAQAR